MSKILFVDDKKLVLDGLRRLLRSKRREWDMTFVDSGEAALDTLAASPFQIIVSDVRMPGMDGLQLLERVKALYPDMTRIVLSGHTDQAAVMRLAGIAHQ